jgi:hypothetical protein
VKNERKRARSFADIRAMRTPPGADTLHDTHHQLSLDGLGDTGQTKVVIENLLVTQAPTIKRTGDSAEWQCDVSYMPDLWHQEDYTAFVLHVVSQVDLVLALRIKQGDVLTVCGVPWAQHIRLNGGTMHTIQHLNVTDMTVLKRGRL